MGLIGPYRKIRPTFKQMKEYYEEKNQVYANFVKITSYVKFSNNYDETINKILNSEILCCIIGNLP